MRQKFGRFGPAIVCMVVIGLAVVAGLAYIAVTFLSQSDDITEVDYFSTPAPNVEDDGPCVKKSFGHGSFVCVCNSTYCDALPQVTAAGLEEGQALVYTSTKEGLRFDKQTLSFSTVDDDRGQTLVVDRSAKYQTVQGFGGAFTDAAGIVILSLPETAQDLLLRSYYSEDGLEYNIGRVPIGGSDFSTRQYSYCDDGPSLDSFKLQTEDLLYKIPMIERAKAVMPESSGQLHLYAAIWSPPTWMKTSGRYSGFGFLKKEYFQAYADYFIKFLEAYAAKGLDFFCVSTGNEPLNGVVPFKHFNSLGWRPDTMHTWIKENFGPTIRGSQFKDIKIAAHDDQRILLPWMLELVASDNETASYIDMIAYHWYLNFITPSSILDSLHKLYPDKPIVNTEACNGDKPWDFTRVQLGSWERGEYYIDDIIEVMNHWTAGWVDWNLALNQQGGPTWAKNWVDSPIIVDDNKQEFYRNPTFYALAHVTKFAPRGSVRVGLSSSGGPWLGGKVEHIAFLRPDNGLAVILLNKHKSSHVVTIRDGDRGQLEFEVPAKSFVSVIYW